MAYVNSVGILLHLYTRLRVTYPHRLIHLLSMFIYAVSGQEGGLQRGVPDLCPGLHPRLPPGFPAQAAAWVR